MGKSQKYTIGTDPEFFIKRKSRFISAIPFVGDKNTGTKSHPIPLRTVENAFVQRDNVAIEFASPPTKDVTTFVESIRKCLDEIINMIPENTTLEATPSARFSKSQLRHQEAKMFGCDPDYNAWTLSQNISPQCDDPLFRSCGGHVHVGGIDENGNVLEGMEFLTSFEGRINLVRAMDILLGIPATILDCSPAAIERRKLYGRAGCHRQTGYGIEYRTLSNFWLKSPELVMLIYNLTSDAIRLVKSTLLPEVVNKISPNEIQRIINHGDTAAAMKLFSSYLVQFFTQESLELFKLCYEKISKIGDIKQEWNIGR